MAKQKNSCLAPQTRLVILHKQYSINGLKVNFHLNKYTRIVSVVWFFFRSLTVTSIDVVCIFHLLHTKFHSELNTDQLISFSFSLASLDWAAEAVPKAEVLRLIYQGRFLHCNVTLGALVLPLGKTTVMHLVPRDNLPEPNSQGNYCFSFVLYCDLSVYRSSLSLSAHSVC